MQLRIYLFGPCEVIYGDQPILAHRWKRHTALAMLKLLALQPQHRLHKEQILDLFWPNSTKTAADNNFYRILHSLRQTLEPHLTRPSDSQLITMSQHIVYLSPPDRLWVDITAFDAYLAQAEVATDPIPFLEAAQQLYRGMLLAEDVYDEWTVAPRTTYEQRYVSLLRQLAQHYTQRADHDAAITTLQRILAIDGADEYAHYDLMQAYAQTGRRTDALRQYKTYRCHLAHEFGMAPSQAVTDLYEHIAAGRTPFVHPTANQPSLMLPSTNLPRPITTFIGRDVELAAITQALQHPTTRILTLAGPPGVGKTRLAIAVAHTIHATFTDGVFWVDLTPVQDPALVPLTIAEVLQISNESQRTIVEAISRFFAHKHMLLVLDNFEHVLAAAAVLNMLVETAPQLTICVTSRAVLRVRGEYVWPLAPLAVAHAAHMDAHTPACALFVERAQAVDPTFRLTPDNTAPITAICRQLDGLPLAIELAAARVNVFSLHTLLDTLQQEVDIVSYGLRDVAERHQSLQAALDWSYQLLSPPAQRLLARLAIFAGGWTLESASAVCEGEIVSDQRSHLQIVHSLSPLGISIAEGIAILVDNHLIYRVDQTQTNAPLRYTMFSTIRKYALQQLEQHGETHALQHHHYDYLQQLIQQARQHISTPDEGSWTVRLNHELDNINAILHTSTKSGDLVAALDLAASLGHFWYTYGHIRTGIYWLDSLITQTKTDAIPIPLRILAQALNAGGNLHRNHGNLVQSVLFNEESLSLYRSMDNRHQVIRVLNALGVTKMLQGQLTEALRFHEEALTLIQDFEQMPTQKTAFAVIYSNRGRVFVKQGNYQMAAESFETSFAIFDHHGDQHNKGAILVNLAELANLQQQPSKARQYAQQAVRCFATTHTMAGSATGLSELAIAESANAIHATRLLGAAHQLHKQAGSHMIWEENRVRIDATMTYLREALGEAAFATAFAEGQQLTLDEAIALALRDTDNT